MSYRFSVGRQFNRKDPLTFLAHHLNRVCQLDLATFVRFAPGAA